MTLRDFKKDVDYVIGEFVDDCTVFLAINPNKATDEVATIIEEAVALYNSIKDKANASVEGRKAAYYTGLRKEMCEKIDSLYEKLSSIVSSSKK